MKNDDNTITVDDIPIDGRIVTYVASQYHPAPQRYCVSLRVATIIDLLLAGF